MEKGWLLTGDVAKYMEDGQFVIVDRLKELIKVKGYQARLPLLTLFNYTVKVAPSELEDLIRGHEGVTDVAVVGVPDERAGEVPRAYVIRKNRNILEMDIKKSALPCPDEYLITSVFLGLYLSTWLLTRDWKV